MKDVSEPRLPSGLYLVATPIGNLGDMTFRAVETLKRADVVACEDTRVSGKLMRAYGIGTPLLSYHEHNAEKARPLLIARCKAGEAVALISDAGTPLVSDPGYKLVRECAKEGIKVQALPGANAALTALILSGLPTDRFLFAGFLPPKRAARRSALAELSGLRASLVFFESPHRLTDMLADAVSVLGGSREAAVARELTKLFEEVRRGSLAALAAHYQEAGEPKGEIVVVIGPPDEDALGVTGADLDRALQDALRSASLRDAVSAVAAATGRPRKDVYVRALALAKEEGHGVPEP